MGTINKDVTPAGTITFFAGDLSTDAAVENLKQNGWLVCDGQSYDYKKFPDLAAAIGNAYGGSSSAFNVPNFQNRFARGVNGLAQGPGGQPVDPDKDSRTASATGGNSGNAVGSLQKTATAIPTSSPFTLKSAGAHCHTVSHITSDNHDAYTSGKVEHAVNKDASTITTGAAGAHSHTLSGGDSVTRPKSFALYFIIRHTTN